MYLKRALDAWNSLTLARQFLLAGGMVFLLAMFVIGNLVSRQIEEAVTRNSAASTALYVDSVIAPLLPDMQRAETLDDFVVRALDETLSQGALGRRLLSFKLWKRDGTILYAKDKNLVGRKFPPGDELSAAWNGQFVAKLDQLHGAESEAEQQSAEPLLEIYNPVLQPWSGDVVAVSEFYEIATDFKRDLEAAKLRSWFVVCGSALLIFAILSIIVFRGSRTIESQRRSLASRVGELSGLLEQNRHLRQRVQRASQRASAHNERYLRRVGAELHDGPAQLLAFASLRLESPNLLGSARKPPESAKEINLIKSSLDEAMDEIRNICNGLVLPKVETAKLPEVLRMAVDAHVRRTGSLVDLNITEPSLMLVPSEKICIYRFVQETLNNTYRHAPGARASVTQTVEDNRLVIAVTDLGSGFDVSDTRPEALGLAGLRERVESLGGEFCLKSSPQGTTVTMAIPVEEHATA
ncbi:sensor histidine kinase [Mesorhizobium denitrificans]|uniref:histidine kinase n=1 Tax=Mesorhizobium denitrificans TaxID=2294114 RepID=A0A371XF87_9HYPH|nr:MULTISPECIES: sensor histidine kinase [Mesorhizobium]RFC67900.1 sensor histidine kinase [Mesorhizobium denitrificans]